MYKMYCVHVYAYSFRTIGNSERTAQQLRDEWYQVHVYASSVWLLTVGYRIAGNFRMVQNFTVFMDRSAAAKIRTTKFLIFI